MGTTNIEELKTGEAFTWGRIQEIYHIGDYDIVRYLPRADEKFSFHCWVKGRDTNHTFSSLDEALIFCIAYKHEGANTHSHTFISRAFGICSY